MSCNKANNCKKYKMNIGNPNPHQNPCNNCNANISDYERGYHQGRADQLQETQKQFDLMFADRMEQIRKDEQDRIANELKKLQTVDVEYCPGGYDDYICKDDVLIIVKGKRWRE